MRYSGCSFRFFVIITAALLASLQANAQAIVSDSFTGAVNTSVWTFVDPLGNSQLSTSGSQAQISVPAGSVHEPWKTANNAARLMQSVANQDFEIEVKFDSNVSQRFQLQGMLMEQSASSFVRMDFYHDGTQTRAYAAVINGGSASVKGNVALGNVAAPTYMRVARQGSNWTFRYSLNGTSWQTAATFVQAMTVASIGVYAGNNGSPAPAHTAVVDYFTSIGASGPFYTLTTAASGSGTVARSPDQPSYAAGSLVQVTAQPAAGWEFDGWSGDLTGQTNPAVVTVNANSFVQANFVQSSEPQYSLTVGTSGSGSVTLNPPGGTYAGGTQVTLTAQPASGWTFSGWSGSLSGTTNPATLTINANASVTANFIQTPPPQYTVTVNTSGSGTVALNPAGGTYAAGTTVQLTATPAAGWTFSGWSGALSGSSNPGTLVMDQNRSVTATFAASGDSPAPGNINIQNTGTETAVVTWTTNVPATSKVAYGIGSVLSATRGSSAYVTAHSVPIAWLRCAQTYSVAVTSVSASGTSATQQLSFTSSPCPNPGVGAAPAISLWDGTAMVVGDRGQAQRWVNVRGNVSTAHTMGSLTYSLNGGSQQALTLGPDKRRLARMGDFNVEIDYAQLQDGLNTVQIRAQDTDGRVTTTSVAVTKVQAAPLALPYTANWGQSGDAETYAYPVDGRWPVQDGRVSPHVLEYDRVLALGDVTWTDFEVTVPVTVNELGPHAYLPQSGAPLVGLGIRWQGHSGSAQPRVNWYPTGAFAWYRWDRNRFELYGNDNTPVSRYTGLQLAFGATYMFKVQVVTLSPDTARYRFKVWNASGSEPQSWQMEVTDTGGPTNGAVCLIAHHADARFGTAQVTFATTP